MIVGIEGGFTSIVLNLDEVKCISPAMQNGEQGSKVEFIGGGSTWVDVPCKEIIAKIKGFK